MTGWLVTRDTLYGAIKLNTRESRSKFMTISWAMRHIVASTGCDIEAHSVSRMNVMKSCQYSNCVTDDACRPSHRIENVRHDRLLSRTRTSCACMEPCMNGRTARCVLALTNNSTHHRGAHLVCSYRELRERGALTPLQWVECVNAARQWDRTAASTRCACA